MGHYVEKEIEAADYAVHSAALADIVPSIQNPKSYYDRNVTGRLMCCQRRNVAKRKLSIRRHHLAMGWQKHSTSENCPIMPEYPYALTKRMGEELVISVKVYNPTSCISLRFFGQFMALGHELSARMVAEFFFMRRNRRQPVYWW